MTPEALRRVVAEIARAHPKGQGARSAALVSDDAHRAIEDALDVSPRTALRWVKRAREAGLL
jgi:transposase